MGVWSRGVSDYRYPWLKLHRRLLEHPWLNQRTEWFAAWVQILMLADHETGVVELSEVAARDEMSEMAWRHFLKKLEREGMICSLSTENRGRAGGKRKTAQIKNWEQYQAQPEERSKERSLEQSKERSLAPSNTAQQAPEEHSKERSSSRCLERSLSILDKEVEKKEVKEKGSSQSAEPKFEKAYNEVAYATSQYVAQWLRDARGFDFERAYDIWGSDLESLWKQAVVAENRKPGDQAKFRFQDACEGTLDLGIRPRAKAEDSAPPKIHFGDVVYHPEQGEFVADFEALYEDAWRCPDGYFIPAAQLRVVRSTDA